MYLLAEYCTAEIYAGWHLYARQYNDGQRNPGWDRWGWLCGDHLRDRVRRLCVSMGHDPPATGRHSQDLAEWFAATFPNGLRVKEEEYGVYRLVEILETRPPQRRGVVRTIAGAARSETARKKREAAEAAKGK